MPRVYTKTARRNYPEQGIRRGDTYHEWCFYRQRPRRSKTYPTRSQLTQNETLLAVYGVFDGTSPSCAEDLSDMISALEDAASEVRDKFYNLPEGFQQGESGQCLEEWADAIDTAVSELEDLKSDMEQAESEDASEDGSVDERTEYDFDVAERFAACEPDLS